MTTKDLGISLHEELDRREKLLTQLTSECDALRTVLGGDRAADAGTT